MKLKPTFRYACKPPVIEMNTPVDYLADEIRKEPGRLNGTVHRAYRDGVPIGTCIIRDGVVESFRPLRFDFNEPIHMAQLDDPEFDASWAFYVDLEATNGVRQVEGTEATYLVDRGEITHYYPHLRRRDGSFDTTKRFRREEARKRELREVERTCPLFASDPKSMNIIARTPDMSEVIV